jgi:hypothetical protein
MPGPGRETRVSRKPTCCDAFALMETILATYWTFFTNCASQEMLRSIITKAITRPLWPVSRWRGNLAFGFTAPLPTETSRLVHFSHRAHHPMRRLNSLPNSTGSRGERDAALTEAERAKAAAAEAEAARLGAEKAAKSAAEERALMEELAGGSRSGQGPACATSCTFAGNTKH